MREIQLTKGFRAIVDDDWFDALNEYKWCAAECGKRGQKIRIYAVRSCILPDSRRRLLAMHRQIIGDVSGMFIDHIDGNGLNNSVSNLRHVTPRQNVLNMSPKSNSTSKFRGVYWDKDYRAWRARISSMGTRITIGKFRDEVDAAMAYNEVAFRLWGEYARLNVIE